MRFNQIYGITGFLDLQSNTPLLGSKRADLRNLGQSLCQIRNKILSVLHTHAETDERVSNSG